MDADERDNSRSTIVVADTSPINYLVLIGHVDIMAQLYGKVLIPGAVERELRHRDTPSIVREWMKSPPEWFRVDASITAKDNVLSELDPGEREAILLAEAVSAHRIIIDEAEGRHIAQQRGLEVIGTLGVIRSAAQKGLLDLPQAIERLRRTRFRIAEHILEDVLRDS